MQYADNAFAQADQGLRWPLTKSVDTEVYADEPRMLRTDCTDTHADLGVCCLRMT